MHFLLQNLYVKLQATLQLQKNEKKADQKSGSNSGSNAASSTSDEVIDDIIISTNDVITDDFESSLDKKEHQVSEKLSLIHQCIPLMPALCDHLQFVANQLQIIEAGDSVDQIVLIC